MKRLAALALMLLFLSGCTAGTDALDKAMALRADMLARAVRFDAEITADYGDQSYSFSMNCQVSTAGELSFTVTAPQTIAGITGTVSATGGKLTFEDTALAFDLMADGLVSPISAPWVLVRTLRGGYLTACTVEDGQIRISIDDSYEEDALRLEIWLDSSELPQVAEIYWQGRRLLTVTVTNFTYV